MCVECNVFDDYRWKLVVAVFNRIESLKGGLSCWSQNKKEIVRPFLPFLHLR
jgi:hypothetical protein